MSKTIKFDVAKEKKSGGSGTLPKEDFSGKLSGQLVKFSGRTLKDIEKAGGSLEGINKWGLFQTADGGYWISVNDMMILGHEMKDKVMHPKFDPNMTDDALSIVPFDKDYTITFDKGRQVAIEPGKGAEVKKYDVTEATAYALKEGKEVLECFDKHMKEDGLTIDFLTLKG